MGPCVVLAGFSLTVSFPALSVRLSLSPSHTAVRPHELLAGCLLSCFQQCPQAYVTPQSDHFWRPDCELFCLPTRVLPGCLSSQLLPVNKLASGLTCCCRGATGLVVITYYRIPLFLRALLGLNFLTLSLRELSGSWPLLRKSGELRPFPVFSWREVPQERWP